MIWGVHSGLGFTSPSELGFDFCQGILSIVPAEKLIMEIVIIIFRCFTKFQAVF